MSIKALQQALEALELNLTVIEDYGDKEQFNRQHKAIASLYDALRQTIEQAAKQEPVAWYDSISGWTDFTFYKPHRKPSSPSAKWIPLYTIPPAAQQEPVAWVCEGISSDEKHSIDYQQEDIDAHHRLPIERKAEA